MPRYPSCLVPPNRTTERFGMDIDYKHPQTQVPMDLDAGVLSSVVAAEAQSSKCVKEVTRLLEAFSPQDIAKERSKQASLEESRTSSSADIPSTAAAATAVPLSQATSAHENQDVTTASASVPPSPQVAAVPSLAATTSAQPTLLAANPSSSSLPGNSPAATVVTAKKVFFHRRMLRSWASWAF